MAQRDRVPDSDVQVARRLLGEHETRLVGLQASLLSRGNPDVAAEVDEGQRHLDLFVGLQVDVLPGWARFDSIHHGRAPDLLHHR